MIRINGLLFFVGALFCFSLGSSAVETDTEGYFMSLKHDEVNLRTGPGTQFPIIWVYKQKNYPIEIVSEHELWRKVKDIDGTTGWVHQAMLSSRRYALVKEEEKLKDKPSVLGRAVALVQSGTLGRLRECPKDSSYCFLEFRQDDISVKGWLDKAFFYGVSFDEEISD